MNLPNKLTVLRIVLIPVFAAFYFLRVIPFHFLIAAAVFGAASLTDLLDGKIARKYGMVTELGKFLDPIADKLLVSAALVFLLTDAASLSVAVGFDLTVPLAVAVAIIVMREFVVSGLRMVAAKKQIVLAADWYGKIKTFVTDIAIAVLLVGLDVPLLFGETVGAIFLITGLIGLAAGTVLTVLSGVHYFLKNPEILSEEKKPE